MSDSKDAMPGNVMSVASWNVEHFNAKTSHSTNQTRPDWVVFLIQAQDNGTGQGGTGSPTWFALRVLEAFECGKMRVMTKEITPGKPTTRRYSKEENDQAVRSVLEVCTELGAARARW
jgi:hypothetical protein